MAFYDEMAQTAIELLESFGSAVTLTRESGASFDPVSGVETPGTATNLTANGVFARYADNLIDGARILATDIKLILAPTIEPLPTDRVLVGLQLCPIVSIDAVKPNGETTLVYFIQVRR